LVVVLGGAKLETKEPLVTAFAAKADHILVGGKIAVDLQGKQDLPSNVKLAQLTESQKDITKESADEFAGIIQSARTVFWNGSMGVFEEDEHQQGTRIVAQAVNTTPAFTMIGGGDTETALTVLNLQSGIDYISTGGGAMLTFLSEGSLVGTKALDQ
jgi:phosphoglycerate kinase